MHSILTQSHDVTRLLLSYGADPNQVDSTGKSLLYHAASLGYLNTVELLLLHKSNPQLMDSHGVTPLMISLLRHHHSTVHSLLDYLDPSSIFLKDNDGTDALMIAAGIGSYQIVKKLLHLKGDPRQSNKDGHTSLIFATHGLSQLNFYRDKNLKYLSSQRRETMKRKIDEYVRVIELLVESGADPTHKVCCPVTLLSPLIGSY